jgi:hypothetical protein
MRSQQERSDLLTADEVMSKVQRAKTTLFARVRRSNVC